MKNQLQRWVDGLMDAKAERTIQPSEVTRGTHPRIAKDLRKETRSAERFFRLSTRKVAQ